MVFFDFTRTPEVGIVCLLFRYAMPVVEEEKLVCKKSACGEQLLVACEQYASAGISGLDAQFIEVLVTHLGRFLSLVQSYGRNYSILKAFAFIWICWQKLSPSPLSPYRPINSICFCCIRAGIGHFGGLVGIMPTGRRKSGTARRQLFLLNVTSKI